MLNFILSRPKLISVVFLAVAVALWILFTVVKIVTWIIQPIKRVFQWKR